MVGRCVLASVLVGVLLVAGCEDKAPAVDPPPKPMASAKPVVASATTAADPSPAATVSAEPAASASATPPAQSADISSIPAVPTDRSDPPSVQEWASAREVNTQGAGTHAPDCTMKILREWLRVDCTGDVRRLMNETDLGKEGVDYYEDVRVGALASIVFRLKKGKTQGVRICRSKDRATLFTNWPIKDEVPKIIALGKGPVCD